MSSTTTPPTFDQALTAFRHGDIAGAKRLLAQTRAATPAHADALHLAALIARREGRWLDALDDLEASLRIAPDQPVVLSNLGNLLRDLRRDREADERYRSALALMPGLTDAWYNRGVLATDGYRTDVAVACFERAIALQGEPRSFIGLGRAQLEATPPMAEAALRTAQEMRRRFPSDARGCALEARALVAAGRSDEALRTLRDALPTVDDPAALRYELGLMARDDGRHEDAKAELREATALRPDMVEAHRALNNLLWESKDGSFLSSWHDALRRLPGSAPLYHNLAAAYIASGAEAEATRTLEFALERLGRDPFLLHGLGVQAVKRGNLGIARDLYDEALRVVPDSLRFLLDRSTLAIRSEDYGTAAIHLSRALRIAPHSQEAWGYQGLLWRLTDDPRYGWLNPYDRLVRSYELPVPQGFSDLPSFMAELSTVLTSRHHAQRQPLDQSVRNGTQTTGVLLDDPHPVLQGLRGAIGLLVDGYLDAVGRDDTHPFLQRIPHSGPRWRHAGSWSVRLGSQGYHTDHVHPFGWLSCCLYVSVPRSVSAEDSTRAGWIRFGRSALALDGRERVERADPPQMGRCILFPAYLWHGTYPFDGADTRLTVPCDFEPG